MRPNDNIEDQLSQLKRHTSDEIDQSILDDAFAALQRSAKLRTHRPWKVAGAVAAAAVLIIAGLLTYSILMPPTEQTAPPLAAEPPQVEKEPSAKDIEPIEQPQAAKEIPAETTTKTSTLDTELKRIAALAAAGDVNSLLAVLDESSVPAKMLAAHYLARIDDLRVAGTLEALAAELTPNDPNNVFFAAAAAEIRNRLGTPVKEIISVEPNQGPRLQFQPRGVLSGLITDAETAEPVTDAVVEISKGRIYEAKTDANGFYHFDDLKDDGNYRLAIYSNEYVGITDHDKMPVVSLSSSAKIVEHFQLKRACMIEVQVIDELAKPVEKVRVWASSLADEHGREVNSGLHSRFTDANGLIILGGFEPSDASYLITATHSIEAGWAVENGRRYRKSEWDYAPGHLAVTLKDPNSIEYGRIVLNRGVEVQGYAEYADGVPAADLKISAYPRWWHSTTCPQSSDIDPNGYFTFGHISPGSYRLQALIPTGLGSSMGVPLYSVDLPPKGEEMLVVRIPRKSPQSLVSISGTITFTGPEKPKYVHINAYSRQHGHAHTSLGYDHDTGELQESFLLDRLEPGKYRLTFDGENIEQVILEDIEAPTEDLEVQLVYSPKPRLTGTVVNADSQKPVTKFKARLRKLRTLRGANYVQSDTWTTFEDIEGRFEVDTVGPGVYQIQIQSPGYAPTWSGEVNTDSGEAVSIELTKGGRITGKVVNEKDIPVPNAKVIPLSIAGGTMPRTKDVFVCEDGAAKTDSQGEFLLEHLPAGTETLKAIHPDYASTIRSDIEVKDGQTAEGIEIVLSKGGTVEGYVYDHRGKPQPGVTLQFQDAGGYGGSGDEEAGRLATVVTDANGYYHVEGLPEKMCYVRRQREWESLGVVCRAILPQTGKVSRLDFGPRPLITGQVVIDGRSLQNRRLVLSATDSPHFGLFRNYTMTDSAGAFQFFGAPAGTYAIYHESLTNRSEWIKTATVQIGFTDVDLGIIPEQMSRLEVSVENEDPNIAVERLYLTEGTENWGRNTGTVTEPSEQGRPYDITGLLPGTYTLAVIRSDNSIICRTIEVTEQEQTFIITIPAATASISGTITRPGLLVWRQDKQFIGYIKSDANGAYKVENMPPGRYFIGGNLLAEEGALTSFELADGEQKELDIDDSASNAADRASLHTMVLDENGVPICGVQAWLTGPAGTIEPLYNSSGGQYFVTAPGRYRLHADYPGFVEAAQSVTLISRQRQDAQTKGPPITFIRLKRQP